VENSVDDTPNAPAQVYPDAIVRLALRLDHGQ